MNDALYAFLGLLNRGGKLLLGPAIEGGLKEGGLLLLAANPSGTGLRLKDKALSRGVSLLEGWDAEKLGQALGFPRLSAVYVKDRKAAKAFLAKCESTKGDESHGK